MLMSLEILMRPPPGSSQGQLKQTGSPGSLALGGLLAGSLAVSDE